MRITIEGTTAKELKAKVAQLAILAGVNELPLDETVDTGINDAAPTDLGAIAGNILATHAPELNASPKATEAKGKGKRGRPPKATPADIEPVQASAGDDAPADEPEEKSEISISDMKAGKSEPTKDEVFAALQKVAETKNLEDSRKIVAKYNVRRVSDLKPADYKHVLADCETALQS